MKNAKFTTDDLYNATFKKKVFGGVSQEQVDEFLNTIMDDYDFFNAEIGRLKEKNEELRKENFKVKMSVLKNNTATLDLDEVSADQKPVITPVVSEEPISQVRDLEKRIIELEKEVAVINAKISK